MPDWSNPYSLCSVFVTDYQKSLLEAIGAERTPSSNYQPGKKYLGLDLYQEELGDDPIPHRLIPYVMRFYVSLISVHAPDEIPTAIAITQAKIAQASFLRQKLIHAVESVDFKAGEQDAVLFRRLLPGRAFTHRAEQQSSKTENDRLNWVIISVGEFQMEFLIKFDENLETGDIFL